MDTKIYLKIKENPKMYEFLRNNSEYYRYLNRNSKYYEEFVSIYKKNKREKDFNKISETIDNIDMISNVIKMVN